jgi:hypothetical protein
MTGLGRGGSPGRPVICVGAPEGQQGDDVLLSSDASKLALLRDLTVLRQISQ